MIKNIIIPGSFKPPHKGHLSLIENIIKNNLKKKNKNNLKIIILISRKQRSLDKNFIYMEQKSKIELQESLIKYYPLEKENIKLLNKKNIIEKINKLINNNYLPSIGDEQSYIIWKIYLKFLKKKYSNNFPKIIIKKCNTNNIISETNKIILELFRTEKSKNIILMKSAKNRNNKRFDYFLIKYKKYVKSQLFKNIKNIDATGMRTSILNNDKNKFINYLPKDLNQSDKNKIWNICIDY